MISARTRVVGVIGDPVTHSRSPAIQNSAFAALGLDWVYVAFPVAAGRGRAAVAAARALGLAGLNVTMPHKGDAAFACDELTQDARRLAAVNTVVRRNDGTLLGDSTDGDGFLRSLADAGVVAVGKRVLVVGAGGAARAVVLALGRAGAHMTVAARRVDTAEVAAALADGDATALESAPIEAADIVVQATPLGMHGEPPPFDPTRLREGQVVVDLVYRSTGTPLLDAARERGAHALDGLGMLVHQAALSFERWTGRAAPLRAMRAAALDA